MTQSLILPPYVQERMAKQQVARCIEARIQQEISKVYPGHLFNVEVQPEQGTVFLDHHLLASNKVRYLAHSNDPEGIKKILGYCGEILERLGLPRKGLEHFDQYDEAEPTAHAAFASR